MEEKERKRIHIILHQNQYFLSCIFRSSLSLDLSGSVAITLISVIDYYI